MFTKFCFAPLLTYSERNLFILHLFMNSLSGLPKTIQIKKDHDSEGIIYPVSLIVKYNNPHKKAIFWEFLEMIEGYNRNK